MSLNLGEFSFGQNSYLEATLFAIAAIVMSDLHNQQHKAHTEVEFMQRTKPTIMNNICMDAKLTSRKRKSILETFFGI